MEMILSHSKASEVNCQQFSLGTSLYDSLDLNFSINIPNRMRLTRFRFQKDWFAFCVSQDTLEARRMERRVRHTSQKSNEWWNQESVIYHNILIRIKLDKKLSNRRTMLGILNGAPHALSLNLRCRVSKQISRKQGPIRMVLCDIHSQQIGSSQTFVRHGR
jgi:hypothetical protein